MTRTRRRKPLSQAVEKNLKEKAKKTRFTYGQLALVYRRGQGAYLSSGSRNVSMAAWAMGRVNSFISGRGGARKADADILRKTPKKRQPMAKSAAMSRCMGYVSTVRKNKKKKSTKKSTKSKKK